MTTACRACTHENRPGSFFCAQCGTKLHFGPESWGVLVRMNGTQQDRRHEIPGNESVIGRAADADIIVEGDSVSKRHARLRCHDGAYEIEDLGSSNGTFVNGRRIRTPTGVRAGDLLRLGSVILKLEA